MHFKVLGAVRWSLVGRSCDLEGDLGVWRFFVREEWAVRKEGM